jgi:hypothetical protein
LLFKLNPVVVVVDLVFDQIIKVGVVLTLFFHCLPLFEVLGSGHRGWVQVEHENLGVVSVLVLEDINDAVKELVSILISFFLSHSHLEAASRGSKLSDVESLSVKILVPAFLFGSVSSSLAG